MRHKMPRLTKYIPLHLCMYMKDMHEELTLSNKTYLFTIYAKGRVMKAY